MNRFGPAVTLRKLVKSGVDADGNDILGPDDTTVTADAKWFRSTLEDTDDRETLTDEVSLLFTGSPDLTGVDQVVIDEGEYEVDGNPLVFKHPRTGLVKTQVNLKRGSG